MKKLAYKVTTDIDSTEHYYFGSEGLKSLQRYLNNLKSKPDYTEKVNKDKTLCNISYTQITYKDDWSLIKSKVDRAFDFIKSTGDNTLKYLICGHFSRYYDDLELQTILERAYREKCPKIEERKTVNIKIEETYHETKI